VATPTVKPRAPLNFLQIRAERTSIGYSAALSTLRGVL
jgi:hypothetical protein